jgi:hypothetical protein
MRRRVKMKEYNTEVCTSYIASKNFEGLTKFAKAIALRNGETKITKTKTDNWLLEITCTKQIYDEAHIEVYGEPYYDTDEYREWLKEQEYYDSLMDDYDDYNYSSHCSVLEGGYDEPTEDEWERSGLL